MDELKTMWLNCTFVQYSGARGKRLVLARCRETASGHLPPPIYDYTLRKISTYQSFMRYPQNLCISLWKSTPLTSRNAAGMRLSTHCPSGEQSANYAKSMAYDANSANPGTPAAGFGQDSLDDIVADILRTQVLDGRHGIAALLKRNTEVDDVALARIAPLIGNGRVVVRLVKDILIHRSPNFDGR
jgi:hypothetical protein